MRCVHGPAICACSPRDTGNLKFCEGQGDHARLARCRNEAASRSLISTSRIVQHPYKWAPWRSRRAFRCDIHGCVCYSATCAAHLPNLSTAVFLDSLSQDFDTASWQSGGLPTRCFPSPFLIVSRDSVLVTISFPCPEWLSPRLLVRRYNLRTPKQIPLPGSTKH